MTPKILFVSFRLVRTNNFCFMIQSYAALAILMQNYLEDVF